MDISKKRYEIQPFTEEGLAYIDDFLGRIPEPYAGEISSLLKNSIKEPLGIRKKILSDPEFREKMLSALREHFRERATLGKEKWRFKDYLMPEYLILLFNIYSSQKQRFPYFAKYFELSYMQVIERDFPFEEKKPEEEDHSKD